MNELPKALAIAIPFAVVALNAWINITIKFEPDAAHATREVKLIFFRVIKWITNIVVLGMLTWQIIFPLADARISSLIVMLDSFALFDSYMHWWIGSLLNLMEKHLNLINKVADLRSSSN